MRKNGFRPVQTPIQPHFVVVLPLSRWGDRELGSLKSLMFLDFAVRTLHGQQEVAFLCMPEDSGYSCLKESRT